MAKMALEGVRVVEFGQLIAIPFATKLLADMGAEVVRIESCTRLDGYRVAGSIRTTPQVSSGTGRSTSTSRTATRRASRWTWPRSAPARR